MTDDAVLSWVLVCSAEARFAWAKAESKTFANLEAVLGKVKESWVRIVKVKAKARHAEACICANEAEAEAGYKKLMHLGRKPRPLDLWLLKLGQMQTRLRQELLGLWLSLLRPKLLGLRLKLRLREMMQQRFGPQ